MSIPTSALAPPTPPTRMAHIALRTNQLDVLIDWYCKVLLAHVAFRSDKIAFLTYDEEHHRIALVALGDYPLRDGQPAVGYYHTAFGYASLTQLMGNFERLRAQGIRPYRAINHGPTVSFYYADPDGNQIELHVDSFPSAEETNAWMQSDAFQRNPIGIDFDPDEMIAKLRSGTPEAELLRRPDAAIAP